MEDGLSASLLLVAGLLRLAAAPRSEPWSADSADQSFLEEGLVTARSHLVSAREDYTGKVTLHSEGMASGPANKGVAHLHGVKGTEAQSTSEDGGQALAGETESPMVSSVDGDLLGHQNDALVTSRSLIAARVSASKFISLQQKHLTIFLPGEERLGNATAQELSLREEPSASAPGKAEGMDPLAATLFDSESLESTGQRTALSTTISLATAAPRSIHTFALRKSETEPEDHFIETIPTPGKEGMGKLVTAIHDTSQQSHVMSQQAQLGSRTLDATRSPGTMTVAQNTSVKSSSKHIFQEQLFEKDGTTIPEIKVEQHDSSSASSPHREMTGHEATELRTTGKPTPLITAQSNTRPFPLLSTPEVLSSATLQPSSKAEDTGQSFQAKPLFPSQSPLFRKSDVSSKAEEHLNEEVNPILPHAVDHQATTQISLFKLSQTTVRESSPLANLQETTTEDQPNAFLPAHSLPQPPSISPSVYGKPQVSITSTFSLAHSTSSHGGNRMSNSGASFHASPPSPAMSRHSIQGVSEIQQPYLLSAVHGEQTSPGALVPSNIDSGLFPSSSAPVFMKPQEPAVHLAPERPDLLPPSHADPQQESDPLNVAIAVTKITTPGNLASPHAGLNISAVAPLAHSRSRGAALLTLAKGEQERELGALVPFQANGQILSSVAPLPTGSASSHVELGGPGTPSAVGPEISSPSLLSQTKTKLPPSDSISLYVKTPPPPGPVHTNSQPSNTNPLVHDEQQLSTLGITVSSHAKSQVPGGSLSVMDESHFHITSAPSHAMTETNGTAVEGGLPIEAEAHTTGPSLFPTSKAQSLASSSPILMEHILLDAPANPGVQPLTQNETQTLNTSSSAPLQHHSFNIALLGSLKPQTSLTSGFVQIEPQSVDASISAGTGTQISSLFIAVSPGLQPQATPLLLVTPRTPEEKNEGKSSSQTSLPTPQAGIYKTSLPGVSTSVSFMKSLPSFASPGFLINHHSTVNLPLLGSAHMEEDAALGTRTTPTLAVSGAQDLPQSFLGLTQHLNRSGELGASNLDSLMANGILGTSPSLQYLSLLVRNAENMVCLQRMQNTTPVPEEAHNDGHGVASTQEALSLSSAFGLPHHGASSLIQMSPSSVILVKPVFVFLPAETPGVPSPPSIAEEQNHETSLSVTLGSAPYASNQEQHMETRPTVSTIQHLTRTKPLSSEPVLSAVPKSTETTLVRSDSLTANPFPQQLGEVSTRTNYLGTPNQNDGIQASTLDSQKVEGDNPVSLTVADHHHISGAPTVMVPVLERPETLPPSAELPGVPLKASPSPSLVEPSASQMLRSSPETFGALGNLQQSTKLMLHTEDHPLGSVTPTAPASKNFEESLNTSSAGNTNLPLEVGHLTPVDLTLQSSLSTRSLGKELLLTPPEVQRVSSELSSSQLLPTGEEHKVSVTSDDSYSETFPVATEPSSYPSSTLFPKLFHFHPISPKPPLANENPRILVSSSTLSSADPPPETIPSGEPLEYLMNHQVNSGLSTNMSSQGSTHSYFAKSGMNPTTHQVPRRRTFLSSTEGQPEPRVSTGEIKPSTRGSDAHPQMDAIHTVPATSGTKPGHPSALLVTTDFKSTSVSSDDTVGSGGPQSFFKKLPLHTVLAGASVSPLQATTALPLGGGTSVMETSHSDLNSLLQPSISQAGFSSPSPKQDQHLKHRQGETTGTTDEFLVRSNSQLEQGSLEGEHLEAPILLDDERKQDAVSSLPTPSPVFSTTLSAPKLPTLSFGIEGLGIRDPRQRSHLHGLSLHISGSVLTLQTQAQPTPGSFEVTDDIQTDGDFLADAVNSTEAISELSPYASGDQVALTRDPTGDGDGNDGEREEKNEEDDGSVADLPPWDSDSRSSDWRAQHHRRLMRSDDFFLNGLAVVSDDACRSGNYTTEMRLQPAGRRGKGPYSPDSFLAHIVLQDNGSHPTLSVKSCCVTPTARPTGLEAASCCLFPRSMVECRYIQIHQNNKAGAASFTIQLFQMLNHSMAYLHCELTVCLTELVGCGQHCLENKEAPSKPSDRSSYETLHNVISFGPVVKTEAEFPPELAAGSPLTMILLTFLLSLSVAVGLMGTVVVLWVRRRRQMKMGVHLAPPGSESP